MERDKNTSEIRIDPQDSIMDRYYIGRRRQDKVYIKRHRNSPMSICTYNIPILLFIFTHKRILNHARVENCPDRERSSLPVDEESVFVLQ